MCGRFVSARKRLELLEQFAATRDAVASDREPDYNVAPTKRIFSVLERAGKEGKAERELRLVRWGLVPSWAKDTKAGARMINARSETASRVAPRSGPPFARRRCLIPADGYYEWMTEGKAKQPFYIHRTDGGLLAFAGIYELWRNEQLPEDHADAWYWSGSIITTQATDEIGRIHDRTPMVIAAESWADSAGPGQQEHGADAGDHAAGHPGRPDRLRRVHYGQLGAEQRRVADRTARRGQAARPRPGRLVRSLP